MTTQGTSLVDAAAEVDALAKRNYALDDCISCADVVELVEYLTEDFRYTHSGGWTQTRSEYVDFVRGRRGTPVRRLGRTVVEFHGDVAITHGDLDLIRGGRPADLLRYVRVWHLLGDQWMAMSHVSVPATDRYAGTHE